MTLQIGGGLGHGGQIIIDDVKRVSGPLAYHEMLPGWLATVSGSWRVVDGADSTPFVILSATVGAAGARTQEDGAPPGTESYTAFDVRLGVTVGMTFFKRLTPYATLAGFGGPVLWRFRGEDLVGSDRYHFQFGPGLAVSLSRTFDVFVEGAPLGARSATVGVGAAF